MNIAKWRYKLEIFKVKKFLCVMMLFVLAVRVAYSENVGQETKTINNMPAYLTIGTSTKCNCRVLFPGQSLVYIGYLYYALVEKEIQTPVLSDQAIPRGRPILAEQQGCRKETFFGSQYPWWYL